MIADLEPYPEYKESGLSWLGQVPGHWGVRKPSHIGLLLEGVGGYKQFVENESFKQFVGDMVYAITNA